MIQVIKEDTMIKSLMQKCKICEKEYDIYTAPITLNPNRERMRIWDTCSIKCFDEYNRRFNEEYKKDPKNAEKERKKNSNKYVK
jgi:hypothetical protein